MRVVYAGGSSETLQAVALACALLDGDLTPAHAPTAEDAAALVEGEPQALLVLDWQLPGAGALATCERIHRRASVPVILVAGHDEDIDRLRGLTLGVDDYVRLPFSPTALARRMRAVLRRTGLPGPRVDAGDRFEDGRVHIDYGACEVQVGGAPLPVNGWQYGVLYHLTRNENRPLPLRTLVAKVWGPEYAEERAYLTYARISIEELGRALSHDNVCPIEINERGVRYACARPEGAASPGAS